MSHPLQRVPAGYREPAQQLGRGNLHVTCTAARTHPLTLCTHLYSASSRALLPHCVSQWPSIWVLAQCHGAHRVSCAESRLPLLQWLMQWSHGLQPQRPCRVSEVQVACSVCWQGAELACRSRLQLPTVRRRSHMFEGSQNATAVAASDISTAVPVAEYRLLTPLASRLGGIFAVLSTHKWIQSERFRRHMITVT